MSEIDQRIAALEKLISAYQKKKAPESSKVGVYRYYCNKCNSKLTDGAAYDMANNYGGCPVCGAYNPRYVSKIVPEE